MFKNYIIIVFFLFIINTIDAQNIDPLFNNIYRTGAKIINKKYKNKYTEYYYVNELRNDFIYCFDTTNVNNEFGFNQDVALKDSVGLKFDFNNISEKNKNIELSEIEKYFTFDFEKYPDSIPSIKYKIFIRFSKPYFNITKSKCVVFVNFWCGFDCSDNYILYLKKRNRKWVKMKIRLDSVS